MAGGQEPSCTSQIFVRSRFYRDAAETVPLLATPMALSLVQRLFGSVFLEVLEIFMSLSEQHESEPLSVA